MNRLVPTAVVGFALMMLFFRGADVARRNVDGTKNQTEAFLVVDEVTKNVSRFGAEALPLGALVGGLALILALGLVVGR